METSGTRAPSPIRFRALFEWLLHLQAEISENLDARLILSASVYEGTAGISISFSEDERYKTYTPLTIEVALGDDTTENEDFDAVDTGASQIDHLTEVIRQYLKNSHRFS